MTDKPTVDELLRRSKDAIELADSELKENRPRFSGVFSRHGILLIAQALLLTRGRPPSNEEEITQAYIEEFVDTKDLDPKYGGYLQGSKPLPQPYDISPEPNVSYEDAQEFISWAIEFHLVAEEYLQQLNQR